jgi:hypothetical protein
VTWFRVDDTFAFHPKVVAAGNEAIGVWVRAGSYASQQLTDGFVPDDIAALMGGRHASQTAQRLTSAGLWVPCQGGFTFHDWEDRNPTRAEVEADRQARADSGAKHGGYGNHVRWHDARGKVDPNCKWCVEGAS